MEKTLREIEFQGNKIYTCPNGCDESELELGSESCSFMAIMGKPHKYIRCGKCGFCDENEGENVKIDMVDVIKVWNNTCSSV